MKNVILLVPDAAEGGAGSAIDLAALTKRVGALEKLVSGLNGLDAKLAAQELKIEALENKKPTEVRIAKPEIKSTNQHFAEELKQLESDPQPRIDAMIEGGLSEKAASGWVPGRIAHLKNELGIKPAVKKAAKAAAMIAVLIALAFAFGTPARAQDQQGYSQAFRSMTNLPLLVNSGTISNTMTATFGFTNVVTIHRGAGIGFQWQFYAKSGDTALAGIEIRPSVDGTNYDSYQQWWLYGAANGANVITLGTNWNVNQLAGYRTLEIDAITNAAGASTPLTNSSATFNVPQGGP